MIAFLAYVDLDLMKSWITWKKVWTKWLNASVSTTWKEILVNDMFLFLLANLFQLISEIILSVKVYLSICLSIYLSIYLSINLSNWKNLNKKLGMTTWHNSKIIVKFADFSCVIFWAKNVLISLDQILLYRSVVILWNLGNHPHLIALISDTFRVASI